MAKSSAPPVPPPLRQAMAAPKMVRPFKVHAAFEPAGDQPEAIAALAEGIEAGERY